MHGEQEKSFVDWFHHNVIGTGVNSLPDEILIVLFDQKQDRPLRVKLAHGSDKCDAFHSRLVSVTNDDGILDRPDTLQSRERGVDRLYVSVRKPETQSRSQCVEENKIVINDEHTGGLHDNIPGRKMILWRPFKLLRTSLILIAPANKCHYMLIW